MVHSNGPLNQPLPAIKGINDYKGHTFHTSRWDYDYTGGALAGELTGLKVWWRSSVPARQQFSACLTLEHLPSNYVFQRTPSSIDVRNNQPTEAGWIDSQNPGWQDERRRNFESIMAGAQVEDLLRRLDRSL